MTPKKYVNRRLLRFCTDFNVFFAFPILLFLLSRKKEGFGGEAFHNFPAFIFA